MLARKLPEADRLIERSLAMEPWSASGWIRRAWLSADQGDDAGAAREMQMTLRVMPFEPMRHLAFIGMGCAHFGAGRYEQAARWVQNGVASVPELFWAERVLVAGTALTGALERSPPPGARAAAQGQQPHGRGARMAPGRSRRSFMERLGQGT